MYHHLIIQAGWKRERERERERDLHLSSHTWVETARDEISLWGREILDAERDPKRGEREREKLAGAEVAGGDGMQVLPGHPLADTITECLVIV